MVSRFTQLDNSNGNAWMAMLLLFGLCTIFGILFWLSAKILLVAPAQGAERVHSQPAIVRQRAMDYITSANPKLDLQTRHKIATAIMMASNIHDLPVGLIVAVCHAESNFNCMAVGPKVKGGQAIGLMQVLWPMHQGLAKSRGISKEDMFTATGGVDIGCVLLSGYIHEEKSIIGALGRYLGSSSRPYILEKVIAGWLAFESGEPIGEAHKQEVSKMKRLTRGR